MLCTIDTETYGLQGGIVEIASVDVIDGKIVNPMSHLVRPDHPISPQMMTIHHTTEVMVADKPWIEDVIPHYYDSERCVARNISFDRRILPEMSSKWICTMKLARCLWSEVKYGNMALYKMWKLNVQTPSGLHHHRALYDCYIAATLFIDVMDTSGWMVKQMADITGRLSLMTTFISGKYRGKAVSDVVERDPGYLHWLSDNLDSMSSELHLALEHYLEST